MCNDIFQLGRRLIVQELYMMILIPFVDCYLIEIPLSKCKHRNSKYNYKSAIFNCGRMERSQ